MIGRTKRDGGIMAYRTICAFCALALMAPGAIAQTSLPFTPPTKPFDNALARVQLSAGAPGVVTPPHTHPTSRVMIYFEAGTNTLRFPGGGVRREVFKAGDVQWNDAMGTHTATITAPAPVDIVHIELKSPPKMTPTVPYAARDPLTVDVPHFKVEIDNNQVRVLRLRLEKGEKTPLYQEVFDHLVVPMTAARLQTTDAKGAVKQVAVQKAQLQWRPAGLEAQQNMGGGRYEALIVEFKR
jgi:hypothetical protein